MIEGGCTQPQPMFGECPFHPGNSMLDCATCKLLKLQADKPARTCNLIGCNVKLTRQQEDGAYCSDKCMAEAKGAYEYVDHPKHYNEHPAGIECIDVIEHMTHNIGAAVKYLWRTGLKPGEGWERELDKALWYINREKERLAKAQK